MYSQFFFAMLTVTVDPGASVPFFWSGRSFPRGRLRQPLNSMGFVGLRLLRSSLGKGNTGGPFASSTEAFNSS